MEKRDSVTCLCHYAGAFVILNSVLERLKKRLSELSLPHLRTFVYPSSSNTKSLTEVLTREESKRCCIEEMMKSGCEQIEDFFFGRRYESDVYGSRCVGDLYGFSDFDEIARGLSEGKGIGELTVPEGCEFSGIAAVKEMRMVSLKLVTRLKGLVSMLEGLVNEGRVKGWERIESVCFD
jgi:hypothetical protein